MKRNLVWIQIIWNELFSTVHSNRQMPNAPAASSSSGPEPAHPDPVPVPVPVPAPAPVPIPEPSASPNVVPRRPSGPRDMSVGSIRDAIDEFASRLRGSGPEVSSTSSVPVSARVLAQVPVPVPVEPPSSMDQASTVGLAPNPSRLMEAEVTSTSLLWVYQDHGDYVSLYIFDVYLFQFSSKIFSYV